MDACRSCSATYGSFMSLEVDNGPYLGMCGICGNLTSSFVAFSLSSLSELLLVVVVWRVSVVVNVK